MISIKHATKSFDKKVVLDDINLEIPDGKIVGLFGLNGAGKTTLLRMMSSVYSTERNTIYFDDIDIKEKKPELIFLSEELNLTNNHNLIKASEIYRLFYSKFDFEYFKELTKKLGFNEKDKIVSYSKGMKKKLGLCLALASNAKYILIDEAFDGVDSISKNEFKRLFFDYIEKNNATIIISSHSINDLESIVDRLLIISGNKVALDDEYSKTIEKYIKFQLAYNEKIDIDDIKSLKPVYIKQNDKFIDLIFENCEDLEEKIQRTNPQFMTKSEIDYSELLELLERGENNA